MIREFTNKNIIISRLINLRTKINEIIEVLEREDDEFS